MKTLVGNFRRCKVDKKVFQIITINIRTELSDEIGFMIQKLAGS
jgi:hypothetical protein